MTVDLSRHDSVRTLRGPRHLAYYPDEELTIVVLSNIENDSAILRAGGSDEPTPRERCGLQPES